MNLNLNPSARKAIYVIVGLVNAVLVPLATFNLVPPVVMAVWASVSVFVAGLAAFNVPKQEG